MAVYTRVSDNEFRDFLTQYDIGEFVSATPIIEGVENSNYLMQTTKDKYIATLFEKRVSPDDLPFFVGLQVELAQRGFAIPAPIAANNDQFIMRLCSHNALIVTFFHGDSLRGRILPDHCYQVGAGLARMHEIGKTIPLHRDNDLSIAGWQRLFDKSKSAALKSEYADVYINADAQMKDIVKCWPEDLPRSLCHADLFPNNVFFDDDQLVGFIDFYFACTDFCAYDLAVTLMSWCFDKDGINHDNARPMIEGYHGARPITDAERANFGVMLRGAALRFLSSRLHDMLFHPEGALVEPHDPREYARNLQIACDDETISHIMQQL